MRIAHISATFPPYKGGTGNVCYHNARCLVQRGHEVHVFTVARAGAESEPLLDGIQVHRLNPLFRLGNAAALPQLTWRLGGFDLLHLHYPFHGGEGAGVAAWLTRTPLVITYHQDVILPGWRGGLDQMIRLTIGRAILRSAKRLLFTSLDYGQASQILPLLSGRQERIGEQPNGVDTDQFSPGPPSTSLRERLGIGVAEQIVLLVAGLDRAHYFKGVSIFLQALAQLPNGIKGIIVGDGNLRPDYERQASALNIKERVIFAGQVTDPELPDYYRLADVAVLPSVTMGEAFGLVLVEAMACAKPVIASDLPGVRTVVEHGRDGFLTPPGDPLALANQIQSLLDLPAEARSAMGRRGRAKVEARYSWERVVDSLEAHYQAVVNSVGQ